PHRSFSPAHTSKSLTTVRDGSPHPARSDNYSREIDNVLCSSLLSPANLLTGIPMKNFRQNVTGFLAAALILISTPNTSHAQAAGQPPPDHPSITVHGRTYTPRSILARNMGTPDDQTTQFPPHKVVGNLYYVGTKTLSSFLVVTPQGNLLINSTY